MVSFRYFVRQFAAFSCAVTLAWDYFLCDSKTLQNFSLWILFIHFIYFQLPLKSRALAFLHPMSFVGAGMVPVMYGHLLNWNPRFEVNNMEKWDISWSTIITRAFFIYIAPILFHTLDTTSNQILLIQAYRTKSQRFIIMWSIISIPMVGLLYEFSYPKSEELDEIFGISINSFVARSKIISSFGLLFGFITLYMIILRRAYHSPTNPSSTSPSSSMSPSSISIHPNDVNSSSQVNGTNSRTNSINLTKHHH